MYAKHWRACFPNVTVLNHRGGHILWQRSDSVSLNAVDVGVCFNLSPVFDSSTFNHINLTRLLFINTQKAAQIRKRACPGRVSPSKRTRQGQGKPRGRHGGRRRASATGYLCKLLMYWKADIFFQWHYSKCHNQVFHVNIVCLIVLYCSLICT